MTKSLAPAENALSRARDTLFGKTPSLPQVEEAPVSPGENSTETEAARRRQITALRTRSGVRATLLSGSTSRETLGN